MESLAGGACALGEVGWTFGSVPSYNVTKCDMRRSMCRSDVSVDRGPAIDRLAIPACAHNFGRDPIFGDLASKPLVTWLPVRLRQSLDDRAGHEQRNDGDDLSDQNGAIQVECRPPLGLAVFDHPRAGRFGAHAKARAPVPLRIAPASAASHDVVSGNYRQPVLLVWLAIDQADNLDLL